MTVDGVAPDDTDPDHEIHGGSRSLAADLAVDDLADLELAVSLATALLDVARRLEPAAARRRARRLTRMFDDPGSMSFSLALTDQVARIDRPERAVQRLVDLTTRRGLPSFLGPLDRVLLRGGAALGRRAPGLVARGVRWRLQRESAGVVLPAEDPAFARHLERRRSEGVALNVNVLGEAILGEDEARRRLDEVISRVVRPDVDHVSVKVSSICAQLSSLAFDHSVERIAERLRVLYRRAAEAQPTVFVNLDMEEHADLEMTLAVFERVLAEPDLVAIDAGIALQAYLPEAHDAFERVAEFAVRRHAQGGGRIKVRLVKGANLAMERVDAEMHGWPQAPYGSKAEVDASYKRLLDRALDPCWGDAVRVGLASHNIFDVAWGLVRARRFGTGDRLELEMLEGMAPGEAEAVRREVGSVLLYAPVVRREQFDNAIAYLVRRLDENTGPENFLRHQFEMVPGSAAFVDQRDRFVRAVAERHQVSVDPRRTQDRGCEVRRFRREDGYRNEPDTDWSIAANRRWLAAHLERGPVPAPERRVAGARDVEQAVQVASSAVATWGATAAEERADRLRRVAEVLAAHRGEAIATMVHDAAKTVAEADTEISEAIDLAAYYAERAIELDHFDASHRPLGPVVVAPPWNFPYAIPAGGVLAALAAGNPVILKPAPETVHTGWLLASCAWEAGVPRDALQFLPCADDDVGRSLIVHPDVAAVILTGAAETARLFLSWRPDLRLHAETSGKNAIVVTEAADLDLAVKDVVRSAFGHAGQKCSAASLVIVEQSVLEDGLFLEKLGDATRTVRVGAPSDPAVDMGPLIRAPGEDLARALEVLEPGERWLVRPERLDDGGLLWSPGIRTGVQPGSFFHLTECFGPVLGVMAAPDLDQAIELQNATAFGLTGGLHSLDPAEVTRWLAHVEVGNAYVNRSTTGAIVRRQPFGGWKRSTVGPAVKAGGPGYVLSLCDWRDDEADDRLDRARASYRRAWRELAAPRDVTGLLAERNELRHRPLPSVVLRIEADADPVAVDLCRLAARVIGLTLDVSSATEESDEELIERVRARPPERLRVLGTMAPAVWRAAVDAWVHVDDRVPVADGHIELRRWSREQSVSITTHRHGNTRAAAE